MRLQLGTGCHKGTDATAAPRRGPRASTRQRPSCLRLHRSPRQLPPQTAPSSAGRAAARRRRTQGKADDAYAPTSFGGPRHPGRPERPLATMAMALNRRLGRRRRGRADSVTRPCVGNSASRPSAAPGRRPGIRNASARSSHRLSLRTATAPTAPREAGRPALGDDARRSSAAAPEGRAALDRDTTKLRGHRSRGGTRAPPAPSRAPHRGVGERFERDESFGASRGLR